jgi:hypothetical protein
LPTTCDIYRPFDSGTLIASAIPCRLTPAYRAAEKVNDLAWTHTLDIQPGVDLRDGVSRIVATVQLSYADGDEVRVPSGGTTRFVVVWIETVGRGTALQYQRAYLLRHEAAFPDP